MVAAAIVGGAVVGGVSSSIAGSAQASAAEKAARLQAGATSESAAVQRDYINNLQRQYDTTRADLSPYRAVGGAALDEYGALYGIGRDGLLSEADMQAARDRFTTTPGYDFRFSEGQKALERSAAAGGNLNSGATGKALIRYGQGVASEEFNNYANRLSGLAGMGQNAAAQTGTLGNQNLAQQGAAASSLGNTITSGAAQQGNLIANAGTARASGFAGIGSSVNSGVNNYLTYQNNQALLKAIS